MLPFFRKIRRFAIFKSQFTKYLIYAVGEIILIVLGILIALYLDNLNEVKKSQQLEIEILVELNNNLNGTKEAFQRMLVAEKRYLSYNVMILDYLDNRKPYSDSLDIAFGTYLWTISAAPISGGYEYLKSKGLELLTNDTLRQRISFLFENEFGIIEEENEVWSNNMQAHISLPYSVEILRKYYPPDFVQGNDEYARPIDYEALLDDEKFKNINSWIMSDRRWNIETMQTLIEKINRIMGDIQKEIAIKGRI